MATLCFDVQPCWSPRAVLCWVSIRQLCHDLYTQSSPKCSQKLLNSFFLNLSVWLCSLNRFWVWGAELIFLIWRISWVNWKCRKIRVVFVWLGDSSFGICHWASSIPESCRISASFARTRTDRRWDISWLAIGGFFWEQGPGVPKWRRTRTFPVRTNSLLCPSPPSLPQLKSQDYVVAFTQMMGVNCQWVT